MSVYVIAEAGINHNGSFELACRLIDVAKKAGADCVKFQTFISENFVSCLAQKAEYQKKTEGKSKTQLDMIRELELPFSDFRRLSEHCQSIGIQFLSTPFDLSSIAFLDTLDMPFWKIPSGEVTDLPYLLAIAKTGKPAVMSTGMCKMEEIQAAMEALLVNGTSKITLLHCSTEYPTPFEDVNLRAMLTMQDCFGVDVGYSDHTVGIEVAVSAAAMGATMIEKHFTLDRNMEGPDHKASLEPDQLAAMVRSIRNIEIALGNGSKEPSTSEQRNINIVRKSIVARCPIHRGDVLTEDTITTKRPGNGISPMRWFDILGTKAVRDFHEDELIEV
jgi:N,N'-diacetyllegionaminate synthase